MTEDKSFHAFTTRCGRIVGSLRNTVTVKSADSEFEALALWDTGATGSCISKKVVEELNLFSTGKKTIQTPSGHSDVNTYAIDVLLPQKVLIKDVVVCDSEIGNQGIDMLVGMDIITLGDFAVSNCDDKTVFTFRMPSKQITDYAKQISFENILNKSNSHKKKRK